MEIVFMMLPALVCLIITVFIWSRPNLTLSLRILGWSMAISFLYATLVAMTDTRDVDPTLMVWSYIGLGFVSPTLQFSVLFLCWTLSTKHQRYPGSLLALFVIPALTGFAVMAGYGLIGFQAAADYYAYGNMQPMGLSSVQRAEYDVFRFLTSTFYLSVVGISMLVTVAYQVYLLYKTDFSPKVLLRFLFDRGPLRPLHLFILLYFCILITISFRMRVDRQYVFNHVRFYCFLFTLEAVFFALVGLLAIKFKSPCIYLRRPHPMPLFDDLPVQVYDPEHKGAELNEFEDEESETYRTLNLRHDLRVLMREEACYLQPGMSRYSVSRHLNVSREGLDRLIRIVHHVNYHEYVMVQRVEYYRRYRQQYPDEPQESVAMACGFQNVRTMLHEVNECRTFFQPIDEDIYQ